MLLLKILRLPFAVLIALLLTLGWLFSGDSPDRLYRYVKEIIWPDWD